MSSFTCEIVFIFRFLIQTFKFPVIEGIFQSSRCIACSAFQAETIQTFRRNWACCECKLRIRANLFRASTILCMCPFHPRKIIDMSPSAHCDNSRHNKFDTIFWTVKFTTHVSVIRSVLFLYLFVIFCNPFRKRLEATAFRAEIPFWESNVRDSIPVFTARGHSKIPYTQRFLQSLIVNTHNFIIPVFGCRCHERLRREINHRSDTVL